MTRPLHAAALAVVLMAASGCASSELRGVRNDLARTTPGLDVREGRSFSFGPLSLGVARLATSFAGDDGDGAMARAALRGARRVQFAHYEVGGTFDPGAVPMPARLQDRLGDGWVPALTVRTDDEVVWVVANDGADVTDEFLFVTLSEDDLTLVKVRGDLREVLRLALAGLREDDGAAAPGTSGKAGASGAPAPVDGGASGP